MRLISDRKNFEQFAVLGDYSELAENVKGHLVEFPKDFLLDEDLSIKIFSMEYYVPAENFI
jgi:hypothetical protein